MSAVDNQQERGELDGPPPPPESPPPGQPDPSPGPPEPQRSPTPPEPQQAPQQKAGEGQKEPPGEPPQSPTLQPPRPAPSGEAQKPCFYKDRRLAWVYGSVVRQDGFGLFTIKDDSGSELANVRPNDVFEVSPGGNFCTDDLAQLSCPHSSTVLNCLRKRAEGGNLSTWAGPHLVEIGRRRTEMGPGEGEQQALERLVTEHAVNPSVALRPCPANLAARALQSLLRSSPLGSQDHDIVLHGESGSGKTGTCLRILSGLAAFTDRWIRDEHSYPRFVADNIGHAHHVVSTFGNASSAIHGNSSRMASIWSLQYRHLDGLDGGESLPDRWRLSGVDLSCSFLERKRSVGAGSEERERLFHAIYALLMGGRGEQYGLDLAVHLPLLLARSQTQVASWVDTEAFDKCNDAFTALGMPEREKDELWGTLAAVVHFLCVQIDNKEQVVEEEEGNGEGGEKASQKAQDTHISEESRDIFNQGCRLLGIDPDKLERELVAPLPPPQPQEGKTCKPEAARATLDAFTSHIYEQLFFWVVDRVKFGLGWANFWSLKDQQGSQSGGEEEFETPDPPGQGATRSISVWDTMGFENPSEGRLSTLCRNVTGEAFHSFFVEDVFDRPRKERAADGINLSWEARTATIPRKAVEGSLKITAGPGGLFDLIEKGPTAKEVLESMVEQHPTATSRWERDGSRPHHFRFRHCYRSSRQGDLSVYNSASMLEDNRVDTRPSLIDLWGVADSLFFADLAPEKIPGGANRAPPSIIRNSRVQIGEALGRLGERRQRTWVACLSPVGPDCPDLGGAAMSGPLVLDQINWLGLASLSVISHLFRQHAEPIATCPRRVSRAVDPQFTHFNSRSMGGYATISGLSELLPHCGLAPNLHFQVGRKKVFLTGQALTILGNRRSQSCQRSAPLIQSFCRGRLSDLRKQMVIAARRASPVTAAARSLLSQTLAREKEYALNEPLLREHAIQKIKLGQIESVARENLAWELEDEFSDQFTQWLFDRDIILENDKIAWELVLLDVQEVKENQRVRMMRDSLDERLALVEEEELEYFFISTQRRLEVQMMGLLGSYTDVHAGVLKQESEAWAKLMAREGVRAEASARKENRRVMHEQDLQQRIAKRTFIVQQHLDQSQEKLRKVKRRLKHNASKTRAQLELANERRVQDLQETLYLKEANHQEVLYSREAEDEELALRRLEVKEQRAQRRQTLALVRDQHASEMALESLYRSVELEAVATAKQQIEHHGQKRLQKLREEDSERRGRERERLGRMRQKTNWYKTKLEDNEEALREGLREARRQRQNEEFEQSRKQRREEESCRKTAAAHTSQRWNEFQSARRMLDGTDPVAQEFIVETLYPYSPGAPPESPPKELPPRFWFC